MRRTPPRSLRGFPRSSHVRYVAYVDVHSLVEEAGGGRSDAAVDALGEARRALQTAAPRLPPHDLQKYEQELQAIQRELAEKGQRARGAFQFRRRAQRAPAAAAAPAAATTPSTPRTRDAWLGTAELGTGGVVAAHLDGCIVDLRTADVSALHLHHAQNTLVLLGDVSSSILLEHCTRCIVVGSVGQCRVFEVRASALLVDTSSVVTLEACDAIQIGGRVAPAPALRVQDFGDAFGGHAHWRAVDPAVYSGMARALAALNPHADPPHVAPFHALFAL